jgi:hypothetical protein
VLATQILGDITYVSVGERFHLLVLTLLEALALFLF